MIQFLADNLDQMDLALDQLAMNDRNFDRFALMLIDNAVELTLHQYAIDKSYENDLWGRFNPPRNDPKLVAAALGPYFEKKVKLARNTGMVSDEILDSLQYLHAFRNTAYHRGLRHERILHSLTLFYFKNACLVFADYSPRIWGFGSNDSISHRAMKYIGSFNGMALPILSKDKFHNAWKRLLDIASSMKDTLIDNIYDDMKEVVEDTDRSIDFLANNFPEEKTRKDVVIESQAWPFAFSEEGKEYAKANNYVGKSVTDYVQWFVSTYPWPQKTDPIPSWRRRLQTLRSEKNPHMALKKYCDFMNQTEELRDFISESASQLDAHIEQLIDEARGK